MKKEMLISILFGKKKSIIFSKFYKSVTKLFRVCWLHIVLSKKKTSNFEYRDL